MNHHGRTWEAYKTAELFPGAFTFSFKRSIQRPVCLIVWLRYFFPNFTVAIMNLLTDQNPSPHYTDPVLL